jgi:PAS domain S-box-containing protein
VDKRALIVDNDKFYVELLGEILTGEGYEVTKAYDGLEALELLDRERPDLVVLDLVMPKIDGDRVCRYIKGTPRLREIPVVILTGTLVEDHEKILAMGADAYVAKRRLEELRGNIRAILQRLHGDAPAGTQAVLGLEKAVPRELVKELLAIKRHKEAILRAIGEGVVEADGRQRVLYVNPAGLEMLGRNELDVVGTPVTEVLGTVHRPTLQQAVARLQVCPERSDEAVSLRCGDRVLRVLLAWTIPGAPESGFFMILQDITDLARKIEELSALNSRLQEYERMRSEFLAMLSHDLHTPLTAVKGSMDVLANEGVGIELSRELLGIAQENADRLFRIVSDILDLTRIEAGHLELRREPFDLAAGLRGAMDRLRRLAEDRQTTMTLQADEGLPRVQADTQRMDQVFTNLLGNALKFTPCGGRIIVTVRRQGAELLTEIRDSGKGIPAEHLDRIFERFYRVPLPDGERVEGTGLGLSICKAIVEEHGGRIWAQSTAGQGSAFSFTLPTGPPRQ